MSRFSAPLLLFLLALTACESAPAERVWTDADGYRWAALDVDGGDAGFRPYEADESGVAFVNAVAEEDYIQNRHLVNGSGVAVGDVNGDDRPDLYFARLDGPNALYLNQGNFRFTEATDLGDAALADRFSAGATLADVDGDGDLDLLVTAIAAADSLLANAGRNLALLLNDGMGRFTEATDAAGLRSDWAGTTLALADVDRDGDLDLYVGNNKVASVRDLYAPADRSFDNTIAQEGDTYSVRPGFEEHFWLYRRGSQLSRFEHAEPDVLYLNDGDGTFAPASWTDGRFLDEDGQPLAAPPRDWALAVRFHDMNHDGWPDLYVANDFESPDRIWMNQGDGTFRALSSNQMRKASLAAMNVDFSDVDRDGDSDFLVVEMLSRDPVDRRRQLGNSDPIQPEVGDLETRPQYMRNTLFVQREDASFAETAYFAGVEASEWTWTNLFVDVDLDGYEDIVLTNGHAYDAMDLDTQQRTGAMMSTPAWRSALLEYPPLDLENLAFRNVGGGRFEAADWGFAPEADVSHGMAAGDLDGDGDLDLVVNRLGRPALVLESRSNAPRVAVRLKGRSNTAGVGALVTLDGGAVPSQSEEVTAGGAYLSGGEALASFAAGSGTDMTITVRWPSGAVSRIEGVEPNRIYEIDESAADARPVAMDTTPNDTTAIPPLFEEVADFDWTHAETFYDDTGRQPLMARRLSQLGPSAAWFDADGDGDDDLLLGSGQGGQVVLYRNDGGRLRRSATLANDADFDAGQVLGLAGAQREALVVQQSYEAVSPTAAQELAAIARFRLPTGGTPTTSLPGDGTTYGPAALADYDGDGDLDLFVGGRVLPARYPQAAPSRIFRNDGGAFVFDDTHAATFADAGLVSAATWTDLDGDGDPDLALATEWGPVRVYQNDNGRLTDVSASWGTGAHRGWWNGVASGDFDGDGDLDLVATNWGLNTPYRASDDRPLQIYFGDYDNSGTLDVIEARHEPSVGKTLPLRNFLAIGQAMPQLRRQVRSHAEFAEMSVEELLGPRLERGGMLEIDELQHVVFYNRSERGRVAFEAVPLPTEAQLSVAFAAAVADYDGDGRDDVFLSQNFFAQLPELPRSDAGRGLLLRGSEDGFAPMTGTASGLKIYGEQRAAAAADFDGDARIDLFVTQNGTAGRLYRNATARPGLRVILRGTASNPDAIGAWVRVRYADGSTGPVRETQAGSGYWSQHSAVPVLGLAEGKTPASVDVRWPGTANWQSVDVQAGQREITFER